MKHFAPVTIVINAHHGSAALNRTLESVAAANPQAAEVIVATDALDLAIREAWPSVKLLRFAENRGPCTARNISLAEITTPYVMFLDAEDCISTTLLGHLCWTAEKDRADLAFASHAIEKTNGKISIVAASKLKHARELLDYWLSGKFVPPCSVVWRTEFLRHLGGWDETLAQNQDGDLIHRALFGNARVSWSRAGYGIYVQRDSNTRVSKLMTPQAIASQFHVLERVERMNTVSGLLPDHHIGKAWYMLARKLYGRGKNTHAQKALTRARELGFKGHTGTPLQRMAAYLLGLEQKAKMASNFRRSIYTTLKSLPKGLPNKA